MSLNRRSFIQNGLGFVSLGLAMPTLLMDAARAVADGPAAPGSFAARQSGKILVVIEMAGGNDGLNTVAPISDPLYAQYRPTIGINSAAALKIDQGLAFNPSMTGFSKLYEQGKLAVVTGVGYPNPNRSHFQSMDIWQSGNPSLEAREHTGWLARYFDADGHFVGDPLSAVALTGQLPLALSSQNSPASVIGNAVDFGFSGRDQGQAKALKTLYDQGGAHGGTVAGGARDFIRNVGNEVYASTDAIKAALRASDEKSTKKAEYGRDGLANGLQTVAKLITGGLPTRVYYLTVGGFDTHANQAGQHAVVLGNVANAINSFYTDISQQGRGDDVVVMTFSEFGRRVKENGSAGTDHGAASVLFVVGGSVHGGVHGQYPSLSDLEDGDLRYHTDFRSVYSTILNNWMGAPAAPIMGGQFESLKFV